MDLWSNVIAQSYQLHTSHASLQMPVKLKATAADFKGTSRGLKAIQSCMNDSYHKSALYWPEPTINPWTKGTIAITDHRHTIAQSLYVKGTMGGIRYGRN